MDKKTTLLFYTAFIGGALLRLTGLGSQSVWIDEFITAGNAAKPGFFDMFWGVMANDPHPPLFYILQFFIYHTLGFSEVTLRLIPVICGIAMIPVVYKFTRMFFSERAAMSALWLFAFNPYQIYYAQEARNYSLFLLISIMMLYYFMLSLKYNTFASGPFVFWSILGVYTHSYAVLLLIIMNLLIVTKFREELRLNKWFGAQAIIAAAALPMIPFFFKVLTGDNYSLNVNMFLAPLYAIKDYLFGFTLDFNFFTLLGVVFALYYAALGIFTHSGRDRRLTDTMWMTGIFYVIVPWILSIWKPVYSERTFMLASFIVIVMVAVGTTYLLRNGIIALTVVFALFYAASLSNYYLNPVYQKTSYKPVYLQILKDYKEGDAIVHSNVASYSSFEFYNRIMFNGRIENRLLNEIPEYKGSGVKMKVREGWRMFRDNILKKKFGLDIYSGYDKNILPSSDAMKAMKNFRRVYYVRDNKEGIKQVWLPVGNVWAASYEKLGIKDPAEPQQSPWVNRLFKISDKKTNRGFDVFTLQRKYDAE